MRRPRGSDDGTTHVLEAVIVASVMLSSVVYVVSLDAPTTPHAGARPILQRSAHDILAILNDTPVGASGDNMLSLALRECLQGACGRLETRVSRILPDGARFAVYVSSAQGLYPVYAPHDPPGEAVSARRVIEPAWSYQFLGLSQSLYDPAKDPLVVYALPVFSGMPLHQGGQALRIVASANRTADQAGFLLTGAATTRAVDGDDQPWPAAASLYFHDGAGTPVGSRDVRAQSLVLGLAPSGAAIPFALRVHESGGGTIPAGALLAVSFPSGWNASAEPAANPGWTILANATDQNGTASSAIVARLDAPLTSATRDLVFHATYRGDALDWYPFSAALSSGAHARAHLLVRADAHAVPPSYEVPRIVASVPRPLGVEATTTWTVSASSPEPIRVSRLEVEEETGAAIFQAVVGVTGGGTWTSEPSKLVWTGDALVTQDAPLELSFRVTSRAAQGAGLDRAAFVPTVDLGGFTGRLTEEVAPGLYRGVFLPAFGVYDGYNSSTGEGLKASHAAHSSSIYRTTALPGEVAYGVGYTTSLKDTAFGSATAVRDRAVSPGDRVRVDLDVQSALYDLALLDLEPSIDVFVYPPWAGDARTPIVAREVFNGSGESGPASFLSLIDLDGNGSPEPSATMGRHIVELDVGTSWLHGPYVVETRVSWLETLSATVGGVALTQDLTRSVSLYDYFVVQPEGALVPPSPLYVVHLVAWFEDWH